MAYRYLEAAIVLLPIVDLSVGLLGSANMLENPMQNILPMNFVSFESPKGHYFPNEKGGIKLTSVRNCNL